MAEADPDFTKETARSIISIVPAAFPGCHAPGFGFNGKRMLLTNLAESLN